MADEKYKIAVASSDGVVVNHHFGKAGLFYIYEGEDTDFCLVEKRKLTPVCDGGNHDENKMRENLLKLSDCKYLLVSRIGNGAANMAADFGIESYEIPGEINASIEQLIKYKKIQRLFD